MYVFDIKNIFFFGKKEKKKIIIILVVGRESLLSFDG